MKKVGILTMYYKSINYGGLLQAYSLCHYINRIEGYSAEQICYHALKKPVGTTKKIDKIRELGFLGILLKIGEFVKIRCASLFTKKVLSSKLVRRAKSIADFRESIPHSSTVYNDDFLPKNEYDFYVVGSDRVWNPNNAYSPYFLGFVEEGKRVSYAASLTSNELTFSQKVNITNSLKDFHAISVRERESAQILSSFLPNKAQWVCDPVMLLEKKNWEEICAVRQDKEEYIFCYFLGKDSANRKLVKKFAEKKDLKIVSVAHANNQLCLADINFGDVKLFEASPDEFLSWIRYARYVFTDSFHATAFSLLFNKEVFVLGRKELKNSGSRIESIATLTGIENHVFSASEGDNLLSILNVPQIEYERINDIIREFRKESQLYLEAALR